MFGRAMFTGALVLTSVVNAQGQSPAPKPDAPTKQIHWHKYVNHQCGLSFWYPDTYSRAPLPPGKGEVRDYGKDSLLLLRR